MFGTIKIWLMVGGLSAIIMAGGALYIMGKRDGSQQSTTKAAVETVERVSTGAKAATQARAAQREGRSPEEGVRTRDGAWE